VRKVLELSPRAGYSSFFLLAAQRATGQGGVVHSYDLEDVLQRANLSAALRRLPYTPFGTPSGLRASEHWLHVGDARLTLPERLDAGGGAPSFGYLFFDSAHTGPFGAWIGSELLLRQAALAPRGTPASIHDVFRARP